MNAGSGAGYSSYNDVGRSIEDAWESVLFDDASVEDALAKATEESNKALERYRGE